MKTSTRTCTRPAWALGTLLLGYSSLSLAQDTTSTDNPYGLASLWAQGDLVAKTTLLILLLMSLGSWSVMLQKLWQQMRLSKQVQHAQDTFWRANTLREGSELLDSDSPLRFITDKALESAHRHSGLMSHVDFNTWVTLNIQRSLGQVQSSLQGGLAWLATTGSTAPFVGLFGTVWGIYHALVRIGVSGQASIDKVAGPVGEALIMTAIGLAVAVPAVLGYNGLVRRNKTLMESIQSFSADLHAVLLASNTSESR